MACAWGRQGAAVPWRPGDSQDRLERAGVCTSLRRLGKGGRTRCCPQEWALERGQACGPPTGLAFTSAPLPRATSNTRVRETVALELSYVNSSLQLLKEELEELDGGGDADGPGRCECAWGCGHGCACACDVGGP